MKHLTMKLRISLALATGLLVAAILATSALAASPDLIERWLAAGKARTASPDLIERMLAVRQLGSSTGRPDDRAGLRGDFPAGAFVSAPSTESVGFDWSDAGVGAGTAAAILLLAGSGLAVARRGTRKRRLLIRA